MKNFAFSSNSIVPPFSSAMNYFRPATSVLYCGWRGSDHNLLRVRMEWLASFA